MASGDFLELAQRACYQARFRPDNSDDLARAKEAINEAYLSVLNYGPRWSFLEQEGSFTIDSTGDVYSVESIAVANSIDGIIEIFGITDDTTGGGLVRQMDWRSVEELALTSQDGDSRSNPVAWAQWNNAIRFYPWPDREYEMGIMFIASDNELSASGDIPLIPLGWRHRLLVPYAASRLMEQHTGTDAINHARYYRNQYEADMVAFTQRYGSARYAQTGLDSPQFSADLPGSVSSDFGYWSVEY